MRTKTQKEVRTTGLTFSKNGKTKGKNEQLESHEVPELNKALAQLFAELRKENDKDYEPDSLKVMQAALRSPFNMQNLSQVYRERYRVPVVKKSLRRKLRDR